MLNLDGYVGLENDSDDEANVSARRAGYTSVPSNIESDEEPEKKDNNMDVDSIQDSAGPSNIPVVLAPVQKAFQHASFHSIDYIF